MILLFTAILALAQSVTAPEVGRDVRAEADGEWARVKPQLDARRPVLEAYVQVAAGWRANANCGFRKNADGTALTASVEQNTLRLGAVLDGIFGGKYPAQSLLQSLQGQGVAFADGPLRSCGDDAREAVIRAVERSNWINSQLPANLR